jgi:hypothetical protein
MILISEVLKQPLMKTKSRNNDTFPKKCMRCICGIENDRGIWCARLKRISGESEVRKCRRFCSKEILDDVVEL